MGAAPCARAVRSDVTATRVADPRNRLISWRAASARALQPCPLIRRFSMSGIIDKIKGKLMKLEGRLTGDSIREAEGAVVDAKGDLENGAQRAANAVKNTVSKVKANVAAKLDHAEIAARRRLNRKRARGY
jgi:uncharacterized protein YjbJ (UPF0337 family)